MKKRVFKLLLILVIILCNFTIFTKPSHAGITNAMVKNKWFYIKNAYSGRYLDVSGGIAAQGTNVQQYEFNGTASQKWFLAPQDDGTFMIGSMVGMTTTDGKTYINYVLDINGGKDGSNGVNLQIWSPNTSAAQKFKIGMSPKANQTVGFLTGPSNYSRVITVQEKSCSNGGNVFQYDYNQSCNDEWILEPIKEDTSFGVEYAKVNYNKYVQAYPNATFAGGDCTNFASQCMLAAGTQHYSGNWKVYRKNGNYSEPTDRNQLDASWELCAPKTSPWMSAKEFANVWKPKRITYLKGSEIVANNESVWQLSITSGDIIQIAESSILGVLGDSYHTMYVHELDYVNDTYLLAYHSDALNTVKCNVKLIDLARSKPNEYFIFYQM